MLASAPDLLRLLAVPLLGWAAWRDARTRRVPNLLWSPLVVLGLALLGWELWTRLPLSGVADRLFLVRIGLSLGFVIPLSLAFWWYGAFGGADAKAFITVAVLFPTYPTLYLPWTALPLVETTLGVFSMTVLTNTVLLGLLFPVALAARNFATGELSPAAFLARRVPVAALPDLHGTLFEDPDGFTRRGLDLDALRMYLRWRGTTLAAIRAAPGAYRDPASIGETTPPGDGRVAGPDVAGDPDRPGGDDFVDADVAQEDGDAAVAQEDADADIARGADAGEELTGIDDPWGAERFVESVGPVYGTTPEKLREGLAVVAEEDTVWVSPGLPFIVPLFAGLVVALTYGDLLFGLLRALGLA